MLAHFASGPIGVAIDDGRIDGGVRPVGARTVLGRRRNGEQRRPQELHQRRLNAGEDRVARELGELGVEFQVGGNVIHARRFERESHKRFERATRRDQLFQAATFRSSTDELDFDQATGVEQLQKIVRFASHRAGQRRGSRVVERAGECASLGRGRFQKRADARHDPDRAARLSLQQRIADLCSFHAEPFGERSHAGELIAGREFVLLGDLQNALPNGSGIERQYCSRRRQDGWS